MNIPGFAAESSVYVTKRQYRISGMRGGSIRNRITPAGTCTCTDPACTWSCPVPPPPDDCTRCRRLTGCAKSRCLCECVGGIVINNPHAPCGFRCA
jgi:hypothetical protein